MGCGGAGGLWWCSRVMTGVQGMCTANDEGDGENDKEVGATAVSREGL